MLQTIFPYLLDGSTWVFDDPATGLKEEAFVFGSSEAISALIDAKAIPNAASGFAMTFDDQPFDGIDVELVWVSADDPNDPLAGNSYRGQIGGVALEGWLCPALLLYFPVAPRKLFLRAEPLPSGVDPIWHVADDDPRQRRFMSGDQK